MRMLVHLVVAVLICGCSALKYQPKGEIQEDGSSDGQILNGPPEGHDHLESAFLSDRGEIRVSYKLPEMAFCLS